MKLIIIIIFKFYIERQNSSISKTLHSITEKTILINYLIKNNFNICDNLCVLKINLFIVAESWYVYIYNI